MTADFTTDASKLVPSPLLLFRDVSTGEAMRVFLTVGFAVAASLLVAAQTPASRVGPPQGTIVLASAQTPAILTRFVELAGGPDSLIIMIPTASMNRPGGGLQTFQSRTPPESGLKAVGAKNVVVLHTFDRPVADSDSFVEPIKRAAGVWLGGGMPEHLLDTYSGTKVELELRNLLARGGVVGGLSAGAVVLASDTVNGALGPDRQWVVRNAFGFLRGVAFQPHAERGPRVESWTLKRPDLLRIAGDNSTAWVVRGDIAEIIGEGNAYVYEQSANVANAPFATLRAGDRYDLAAQVIRRGSK